MLNKGFVNDMESIMTKLPQNTCKGCFQPDDNINSV